MAITSRTHNLTEESAGLSVRLAQRLKGSGLDLLVWVSPLACRSPEETKIWHPFYAQKPALFKIGAYLYLVGAYSLLGLARFFLYKGFYYNLVRTGAPVLLIIPDEITDHSAEAKTDYLIEEAGYPVDKLVFSRIKNVGSGFSRLRYPDRAGIFIKLLSSVSSDFIRRLFSGKISFAYLDAFVIYLRWVISQSWYFHWDFYYLLKEITGQGVPGYRALLSMHEMHFYSKVIWRVAQEQGGIGLTAQHAMIVPEKLWYFPHKFETEAGCPLPGVFFVYSDEIKNRLASFYPGTRFELCCSPRFSKWKQGALLDRGITPEDKRFVTFVGAIPFYDTKILIRAIKNLLGAEDAGRLPIKFRPHPYAKIDKDDRLWIQEALRRGEIVLSKNPLKEDLLTAALIIGSNSTVLQEAALSGVPALGLYSPDFISASVFPESDEWMVPAENVSWERLQEQINKKPDGAFINRCRNNMGLYNADLTTGLIYKTARILKDPPKVPEGHIEGNRAIR